MLIRKNNNFIDLSFSILTFISAFLVIALLIGIVYILYKESSPAINSFGFFKFIFSKEWDPVKEKFGGFVALYGTLITTTLALIFATPIAMGIAIFVTEVAPEKIKGVIGGAIELLAAIPSIIYGMWGLFTLAPIMSRHVEPFLQKSFGALPVIGNLFKGTPLGVDLLTSSIILGIMIIPFTASIARETINLTPPIVKESAYAMGATKWEVIKDIVLPYSKLGIFGGIVISMGRALGETMAVAFVLGNKNAIATSLFDATTTVTVKLANEFTEADKDIYLSSLYFLVLLLFIMSFLLLSISKFLLLQTKKKRV